MRERAGGPFRVSVVKDFGAVVFDGKVQEFEAPVEEVAADQGRPGEGGVRGGEFLEVGAQLGFADV